MDMAMSIWSGQCPPAVPPEHFESEYERIFGRKSLRVEGFGLNAPYYAQDLPGYRDSLLADKEAK